MADAAAEAHPDPTSHAEAPDWHCFYCKLPTLDGEDVIWHGDFLAHRFQRTCDERKAAHSRTP